jgi:CheY-like chemotaxis protein
VTRDSHAVDAWAIMAKKKIVIVEDELITAAHIEAVLADAGYEVSRIARSGEEAIRAVRETGPDLVLMDIMLAGGINGIEAVRSFRESHDVPVIYMTSNTDSATVEISRSSSKRSLMTGKNAAISWRDAGGKTAISCGVTCHFRRSGWTASRSTRSSCAASCRIESAR